MERFEGLKSGKQKQFSKKNSFIVPILLLFTLIGIQESLKAQSYCSPTINAFYGNYVKNVTIGGINKTTGGTDGAEQDYTGDTDGAMTQGTSYSISFTFRKSASITYAYIYIDWNDDGDFSDASETLLNAQNCGSGAGTDYTYTDGSYTCPTIATGTVRMRVATSVHSIGYMPCGSHSYGEYEDYEIVVSAAAGPNVKDNNTTNLNAAGSWTTAVPTTSEVATWESTVVGANTTILGGNVEFQGLAIDDPGGLVTINSGSTLTIGTDGIDMADATQNLTMNQAVTLGSAQSWTVNTGKTLTAAGAVGGSVKLTKAGAGTLTLSGTNTFTGGVDHDAGILNIGAAAALGTTAGTLTVASGTTIDNSSGGALTTSNYPLNLRNFTFTGTNNLNFGTGATAMAAATTITTSASELELGGVVSGAFKMTKAGAGTLTLSGTNTFTGGVDHNAGTLNIDAAAALGTTAGTFTIANGVTIDNTSGGAITTSNYPITISDDFTFTGGSNLNFGTGATALSATSTMTVSASELEFGGVISGSFGIVKAGAGTLTLVGNNTFTGGVTHNAGTLNIDLASALGTTAGTFTIASGTTIDNTSGGAVTTSNYPISMNSFTFTGSNDLNLGTGAVTLGENTTVTASANDITIGGVISGAYTITGTGAGNVILAGESNTYTGKTSVTNGATYFKTIKNVSGGSSSLGAPTTVGNGTIPIGSTTTGAAIVFNGSSDQSTDRVIDLAGTTGGATIDAGSAANLTFTSAFTATGVGSKTLTIKGSTASNEIQGAIVNNDGSNTTALTKEGSGTWSLTGTNTYTGTTTISAGTLGIGSGGTAGSIASASVVNAGTIAFNRSDALTYSGVISSTGALTKAGAGTLTLSGANTYTGTTTINAGTIELGASGVIADGSNFVMNGGDLHTGSSGGYGETVGTLDLSDNSSITLGTGDHTLQFAASNGETWTAAKTLTINGWTSDYDGTAATAGNPKVFFGSGSSDLSAAQIARIGFFNGSYSYQADLLATGEIVAKNVLLPVELIYFGGTKLNESIELAWTTGSEINSDYFEIQRAGGYDMLFEPIGTVAAAGESYSFLSYEFTDYNPLATTNFYKLVEYDYDGTEQESKIIKVVSLESSSLEFISNNESGQAIFNLDSKVETPGQVQVINIKGQIIDNSMIFVGEGGNQFTLNTLTWETGYYFMTLTGDGLKPQTLKFFIK